VNTEGGHFIVDSCGSLWILLILVNTEGGHLVLVIVVWILLILVVLIVDVADCCWLLWILCPPAVTTGYCGLLCPPAVTTVLAMVDLCVSTCGDHWDH
jgi:hypothetical protein